MSYNNNRSNYSKLYKLPPRWEDYTKLGNIISGTRIVPFKTPLREEILRQSSTRGSEWFTPEILLEGAPNIKLVIDLTQTDRFYRREDFLQNGVNHKKLVCPGGGKVIPSSYIVKRFNDIIDNFMQTVGASNQNAIIGVHCTHGLNRTGYLICKYMIEHCGFTPNGAIQAFENARGHKMERELYLQDIRNSLLPQRPLEIQHNVRRLNNISPCPRTTSSFTNLNRYNQQHGGSSSINLRRGEPQEEDIRKSPLPQRPLEIHSNVRHVNNIPPRPRTTSSSFYTNNQQRGGSSSTNWRERQPQEEDIRNSPPPKRPLDIRPNVRHVNNIPPRSQTTSSSFRTCNQRHGGSSSTNWRERQPQEEGRQKHKRNINRRMRNNIKKYAANN